MLSKSEHARKYSQICDAPSDERIGSAIGIFVPTVSSTDCHPREHGLDRLNLAQKLLAGEISAIESLGANRARLDNIFIAWNCSLQGCRIGIKRLLGVGPVYINLSVNQSRKPGKGPAM
jgi:hypothetical protein